MHTIVFLTVYFLLADWRFIDDPRLVFPPLFFGVLSAFIMYDLFYSGVIPTEEG